MKRILAAVAALVLPLVVPAARAADPAPLYVQDFAKVPAGAPPDELLVLDGQFSVKDDGGNMVLELPGAPLDTYGFLFGPSKQAGVRVAARIKAARQGRKFPVFAVGLCGAGGFRLQVSPAKQAVELLRGDAPVTSAPFAWKSGGWTRLSLQLVKTADGALVEGKVWNDGDPEPAAPQIKQPVPELPAAGRAGAWGLPFSGNPIEFDDLVVAEVSR
jgi:hypothetical protein